MLKKLCLFKIIILTLRHNSKVIAYQLIGFVKDENIEMVQFHQSYSYEDFVQGIRPSEEGGFERRNGHLRENGFPRLYKPCGESFYACSEGLLLQISPWDYHMEKKTITREQCLELNEMAERIAEWR